MNEKNTSRPEAYKAIIGFIKASIGLEVNETTIFFKDLDLIGQDADEFIRLFSEQFDIDMTDFRFNEYFVDEYNIPFGYWFDRIFRKKKLKRKEFNIKHLESIVIAKKWLDA